MVDGEHGAALVVGDEAASVGVVALREDIEQGDARGGYPEPRAPVGAAGGDDDAVDPLGEERLDVLRLALGIVGGVAHEDGDAAVGQALLEPLHDRDGEAAEGVGGDQADGEGLPAVQALGEVVGAEAEFLGARDHPLARLLAEAAIVVERLRHGADTDLSKPRDVADGRPARDGAAASRRRATGASLSACSAIRPRPHFTAPLRNPET